MATLTEDLQELTINIFKLIEENKTLKADMAEIGRIEREERGILGAIDRLKIKKIAEKYIEKS